MVDYSEVIKQSKAYEMVIKDKASQRLSHTYLLVSEDQDYAFAFAKIMSAAVLNVENKHSSMLKIEKNIHPDVIIFGEDEKIMVADAEKIVSDVFVRPFEEDSKVYILLNFDECNEETQNKLLKTIEEPTPASYFILTAKSENKLLQTVISRCKMITLDLISEENIEKMLSAVLISGDIAKTCASCCAGVFSRAYKMAINKDFISLYNNIFACLKNMNTSRDVLKYANIFSSKEIDKAEFADLMMTVVRDLLMIKIGDEKLINNKHKIKELGEIAQTFSVKALSKIIEYCLQLKEDLIYNTNGVSAIDALLFNIVEAKVTCKE